HPRWRQKSERVIGGGFFSGKQSTLMFNGYEKQVGTSWHVLIASAPSIGCDWTLPVCRRWNEDVFSPFQDSNQLHRQSPDYCARRIPNAPNSVLDSSGGPDATMKRCRFDILSPA